jgi:hypothetical protein
LKPELEIRDDEPALDQGTWLRAYTEQSDYSRFSLGEWVREKQEPRGHRHTFVPKVGLDAETFDRYYESTVPYRRMTERRTYQLLRQATRRLHAMVQLHTNLHRYGVRLHEELDVHRSALVITGSVSDWLSASFVYLQTEETFWKHCGEEESSRFEQATNDAYDAYPAYRLLYQMRNYAHHYGPPLAALDYSTDDDDAWDVDIMVDKRTLLGGSFDWNKKSKAVMADLPERFAIMPLISEAMKGYKLIERRVMAMYLEYVESWLDEAHAMLDALGEVDGMPCLLAIPPDRSKAMQVAGAIGIQPITPREGVDKIEWSLQQPDPIDAIWVDQPLSPGFVPDDAGALRATAVLAAYFAGDGAAAVEQANQIVFDVDEGNPSPLFSGLINRSAISMYMLAGLLGNSPEELLNIDWTAEVGGEEE